MKRLILLAISLVLLSTISTAQVFEWAAGMGGTRNDLGVAIATDASGNVYTTGYFRETADFDPGTGVMNLSAAGGGEPADMFLQKLDNAGNLVWVKRFGGSAGHEVGEAIALDASGNIYIAGYFNGTVDFDPGPGVFNLVSNGLNEAYVLKLDNGGTLIWARSMGGAGWDWAGAVAVDGSGNVYTTGHFGGVADLDPGPGVLNITSVGGADIFVQKLDAAGNLLWVKTMGGAQDDIGVEITVGPSGNVHLTGYFQETVDFDPNAGVMNLVSAGARDIFVMKINAGGNLLWAKSMGGASSDEGLGIAVDATGNVYTTGYFQETTDFDPGVGSSIHVAEGQADAFVQKLDASGNFVWVKTMGGVLDDVGRYLALDTRGDVYITGWFYGTADFDPGTAIDERTSAGSDDIFVEKLTANGDFTWVVAMGGTGDDKGILLALDGACNVYTTGHFQETIDLDPAGTINNLTAVGSHDIFIQRLSQTPCATTGIKAPKASQLSLYPNPSSGLFQIELPAGARDAQVQITDGLGRAVHQSKLASNQNQLDLSFLPTGVYYIEMTLSGEEKFYGKVVLRR